MLPGQVDRGDFFHTALFAVNVQLRIGALYAQLAEAQQQIMIQRSNAVVDILLLHVHNELQRDA